MACDKMKIGIFTIASKNYLSYVRTLMASVADMHPEYRRYLCLADRVDEIFDVSAERYEIIQADQIGIPSFDDMALRYDIMEFNTAVKPFMIRWLLENTDLDVVIYLDPDIKVYSRFDLLETEFEKGASVVLTPHITRPLEDGLNPNDYHMLQAGVFNLGFIAVRRCDEAIEFISWWGRRLSTQCAADFANNLFTDQKWCDLAPSFLDKLVVFKNLGYNVAYWNLAQRQVTQSTEGSWLVNGERLVFFHFSGVSADRKNLVSKHQNRFSWADIASYQSLFSDYLNELIAAGWETCGKWPYAYAEVSGSFKVLPLLRQLYRETHPQPIVLNGQELCQYLIAICNQSADEISGNGKPRITRLMVFVHRLRPDLQAAFNLNSADGRNSFANWFEVAGEREYGLPSSITQQELIECGNPVPCSKKKNARVFYRILMLLDVPIRKNAHFLPTSFQQHGKRWWRKIKNVTLRSL